MTTSHLCPSFQAATSTSSGAAAESPAQSTATNTTAAVTANHVTPLEEDPAEDLIPKWDDVNGIIHQLFNDEDDDEEGEGRNNTGIRFKREEWLFSDSSEDEGEEEQPQQQCSGDESDRAIPPPPGHYHSDDEQQHEDDHFPDMTWRSRDLLRISLADDSVEPTEETTDYDDDDDDSCMEEENSNGENHGETSNSHTCNNNSSNCSIAVKEESCRFSLPKSLFQKSTNYPIADKASSLKSFPAAAAETDLSEAVVLSKEQDEIWIRADLLRADQLPDVLDLVRGFQSTRRIVVEEVHQGSVVEALLIYFFQCHDRGNDDSRDGVVTAGKTLRSLSYSGTWISPSLVENLASPSCHLEELELGISLYRSNLRVRSVPTATRSRSRLLQMAPRRNIARQLQRLDELEEALAANTSLRVLSFLPCGHLKVTEGLIWAASCHPHLERVDVVVPLYTPQNTVDVHESGLLLFEGIKELMLQSNVFHSLSLIVDPSLCTLRKKSHEILSVTPWEHFTRSLAESQRLTKLKLEFMSPINEQKDSLVPRDVTLNFMKAITKNTSLQSLTLVNVPVQTSIDFWHGVQMRETPFADISLYKCSEVLSFCMCANDSDSEQHGWLKLKSLHVDQASLSDDLYGLEVLLHGGVKELLITDTLSKKDAKQLVTVLNDSAVKSLVVSSDSHHLLTEYRTESLESLHLQGGQVPVSSEAVCRLLDNCSSLRHLRLSRVNVMGDWNEVVKRMESHSLRTLEMEE